MVKVLKSGFFTTLQDAGRFGYRRFGVPISGSMDTYASKLANLILGNTDEAAVLEITMTGPVLQFLKPTVVAISGADMQPFLNNIAVSLNSLIKISTNDILRFGALRSGFRTYLAVKGGFRSEVVLGSQSQYKSITPSVRLNNTDLLHYSSMENVVMRHNALVKYDMSMLRSKTLKAYKGPEYDKLADAVKGRLFNSDFRISKLNNRMAYQLETLVINALDPILTGPVLPGTVQLTPSGQLIVLMRDGQTTGGYPRILQLTERSINILSQKITGDLLKIDLEVL